MGRIHSIETMGLVDGPGIRFVVFYQGCRLRCSYCHNPDTWALDGGMEIDAGELLRKTLRYRPYFQKSGGGVTCSGGEPLMQPEFLLEYLRLCKAEGLHIAIDTAGCGKGDYGKILDFTDLVILDLKHVSPEGHEALTGGKMEESAGFKRALDKAGTKLWIRHVIVPGLTDNADHLHRLKKVIAGFGNVEKVELLPYHTLGVGKYAGMGQSYRLDGVKPISMERINTLRKIFDAAPAAEKSG